MDRTLTHSKDYPKTHMEILFLFQKKSHQRMVQHIPQDCQNMGGIIVQIYRNRRLLQKILGMQVLETPLRLFTLLQILIDVMELFSLMMVFRLLPHSKPLHRLNFKRLKINMLYSYNNKHKKKTSCKKGFEKNLQCLIEDQIEGLPHCHIIILLEKWLPIQIFHS